MKLGPPEKYQTVKVPIANSRNFSGNWSGL